MVRVRPAQALAARQGIILLVVITLLTLFAVVGITFVLYAQAEASSMRAARQSESLTYADADPEMLLAYYLSQLIYGTNNPLSAMRSWDLGSGIYGAPGNTVAYNGTGRILNAAANGNPNYWNYVLNGRNPAQDGAPNPPYTYPDINSFFLAAVQPNNGNVLIPSFVRNGPSGQAAWWLRANLPPPEDGRADVKNLPDSPGWQHRNGPPTPNDSIWMDLGFPVMHSPDGREFKPLFAALIQDLDGRVNVNMGGNILTDNGGTTTHASLSHQGWSLGEINLNKVLTGGTPTNPESANLFITPPNLLNRYDPSWSNPKTTTEKLNYPYAFGGHFYGPTDLDCNPPGAAGTYALTLPSATSGWAFPQYGKSYGDGWANPSSATNTEVTFNPMLFNFFDPRQNCYGTTFGTGPQQLGNRVFPPSDMEALLRYYDTGSPALTSDLFLLCPQSFQANNGMGRRLITTHSFDISAPGVIPCITTAPTASQYLLPAATAGAAPGYPTNPPIPFPPPAASPNSGEFNAAWGAVSQAQTKSSAQIPLHKRIDLNRGFVDYPTLKGTQFSNPAGYQPALQDRQTMALEIFNILIAVTGADNDPNLLKNPNSNTKAYDALRWLAQLAVNIVDFVNFSQAQKAGVTPAPDDIMTCFNWNTQQTSNIQNGWVFGTVLPRLVVNEAYVEIDNNPNDMGLMGAPRNARATEYDLNCWVELLNPFAPGGGGAACANQAIPTTLNGNAQLYFSNGGYGGYRLLVVQNPAGDNGKTVSQAMAQNNNVLGMPYVQGVTPQPNVMTVVDWTTSTKSVIAQQVQPPVLKGSPPNVTVSPGAPGSNQGFYVLGPNMQFPGAAKNFPTFQVDEQKPSTTWYPQDTILAAAVSPGNPKFFTFKTQGNSMRYTMPAGGGAVKNPPTHAIVLQRLACPYMVPQSNPSQPNFNPYVTVDYILNVPTNDGVNTDSVGPLNNHQPIQTKVAQRYSVGRNQPYAADGSQQVSQQTQNPPPKNQPLNSFFTINSQAPNKPGPQWAYDWLFHANRPLVSPIELLQVSGYKPHLLTQMFMLGGANQVFNPQTNSPANTGQAPTTLGKFQHRAPWIVQSQLTTSKPPLSSPMIYRALEFFEAGLRPQWSPIGGRFPGKININTIWDQTTWQALCDQQPVNFFNATAVTNTYTALTKSRTPTGVPGPKDVPFYSLAAPFSPAGTQYPQGGCGIQNTLLRPDPNAVNAPLNKANPLKLLLEQSITTNDLIPQAGNPVGQNGHPYLRLELLNKIFNNVTTRSNVFAVWLTVGFFEVTNDAGAGPPQLGAEINKAEGRNVRHRMFAIIDRTNLSVAFQPVPGTPQVVPGAGQRPFFINALPPAPSQPAKPSVLGPGKVTFSVPAALPSNGYEDMSWGVNPNSPNQLMIQPGNLPVPQLVVDTGITQEVVNVTSVTAPLGKPMQITATFKNPHPIGFAVSNAVLGNPGPQTFFDPRNPQFGGVVRYFSIIE